MKKLEIFGIRTIQNQSLSDVTVCVVLILLQLFYAHIVLLYSCSYTDHISVYLSKSNCECFNIFG